MNSGCRVEELTEKVIARMASVPSEQEQIEYVEPQAALPAPEPAKALPPPDSVSKEPSGSNKGSLLRKLIVLAVILGAVAAVIWKVRANQQEQQTQSEKMAAAADRPVPVSVVAVQQRAMPIYLTALGTVTAYNTVTVRSRVDGQLLRVNFREGQSVRKGQLLAEIDPRPYQAALAQAEGQLVKDQANAKNADAEAARYTALYQAGVVSKESQQAQLSTSGQATGSIQADQAAIDAARVNLIYTRITSPIDGVVGLRQVDPGNIVHATDTTGLVVVTQLQPISVIFTLPEDSLPQVLARSRSGRSMAVEAYDRSDTTHLASGSLLTLDNQIDTTTGTDKVKAVFPNQDNALFPNQFVNVRLVLQDRPNAIVIPSATVQTGTQGSFVYLVHDGNPPAELEEQNAAMRSTGKSHKKAGTGGNADGERASKNPPHYVTMQPIKIELTEGTQVILAEGLRAGDQVVIDGQEKLKNGSRVITHSAAPSAGSGANAVAAGNPAPTTGPTSSHARPENGSTRRDPGLDEPRRAATRSAR